ncbi:hypothetical protein PVK06_007656 [Gossypium arboreum]|uniref:Aminotransferase-like plant mobile domain-containing protein n=1 Tax=Gossypium arboreum TaxID=29729 RepID=A0ABR0QI84_GOSAR|nr:hypothetical protein PVK06_007656 [Gossypium arboreum]
MLNKRSKENLQQMSSLIDNENKGHISSNINEMVKYRVLRGRIYNVGFQPDERVIPFLELAGFGSAVLIRTFDLRYDLISALVERWHPETHTFHLSCGECTITLEDVAVQLGLPIDGNVVTGVSSISRPAHLCYELLGRSPSEGKFATLRAEGWGGRDTWQPAGKSRLCSRSEWLRLRDPLHVIPIAHVI